MSVPRYEEHGGWKFIAGHPLPYLRALQLARNSETRFDSSRIEKPDGKRNFDRFLAAEHAPTPKTLAYIENGTVHLSDRREPLRQFLGRLPFGDYFCKLDHGTHGDGAFHLTMAEIPSVNGTAVTRDHIEERLGEKPYLIQEWLVPRQHALHAEFCPSVINTLRLISFDYEGAPRVISAFFRSALGTGAVDNWTAGGVAAAIDLERQVLTGTAILNTLHGFLDTHPATGVPFGERAVPHLSRAIALVERLHGRLRIRTLGWDVAILKDGPVVLECNGTGWDMKVAGILDATFIPELLRYHCPEPEHLFRVDFAGDFSEREKFWRLVSKSFGFARVSGRLEALTANEAVVHVAGSPNALKHLEYILGQPILRRMFRNASYAPAQVQVPLGLDLSASYPPR